MNMHLTDDELHALVARDPTNDKLLKELRWRVRWNAIRKMANPRGTCNAGLPIYSDQRGAMSSGYICHEKAHSVCNHGVRAWDRDERNERLKAIAAEVRD